MIWDGGRAQVMNGQIVRNMALSGKRAIIPHSATWPERRVWMAQIVHSRWNFCVFFSVVIVFGRVSLPQDKKTLTNKKKQWTKSFPFPLAPVFFVSHIVCWPQRRATPYLCCCCSCMANKLIGASESTQLGPFFGPHLPQAPQRAIHEWRSSI